MELVEVDGISDNNIDEEDNANPCTNPVSALCSRAPQVSAELKKILIGGGRMPKETKKSNGCEKIEIS